MRDAWIEFEDQLDPSNGRNKLQISVYIHVQIFDLVQLSS